MLNSVIFIRTFQHYIFKSLFPFVSDSVMFKGTGDVQYLRSTLFTIARPKMENERFILDY